jgi:asparagine N-glycosylation enzyme membrane subunit Stt3
MKINKDDVWIKVIFGVLKKLTLIAIVLKLFNLIKISWILVLLPLWAALIIGFLLGLLWFITDLIEIIKNEHI